MEELLEQGFRFILLSYASEGFGPGDLGKEVGPGELQRFFSLSADWGSHPAFEGGEAETLVLEAPLYKGSLEVKGTVREEGPYRARFGLEEVRVR